jgi:hypothetical protein
MFDHGSPSFLLCKRHIHAILSRVNSELSISTPDAFTSNRPCEAMINLDGSLRLMKIDFVGRMPTRTRPLDQV